MGTVYHSGNTALGLKNLLINANGLVNNRGYVSGTATTVANQYTVDRWRVVTSGQNLTFTTTNGITTFTAPAGGVEQVIENLNIIGGSYVFSHVGTATKNVYQSSDNVTYTEVIAVDGIYTVAGGYYVKIKFSNGTFSLPQFEAGKLISAFEQRPYGLELSLCQRYLRTLAGGLNLQYIGIGKNLSTIQAVFPFTQLSMRTKPTLSYSAVGEFSLQNSGSSDLVCTALSIDSTRTTTESAYITATVASGLVGGDATIIRVTGSSSSYMYLNAEL